MQVKTLSKYLDWANLNPVDRKIIVAVCFDGSPELARRKLKLHKCLFYYHWAYLKSIYKNFLNVVPSKVIYNLRSCSRIQSPL